MARQIQLIPELQQVIDDFETVRVGFLDLAEAYYSQQLQLQKQQTELENATKEITALRQIQAEKQAFVESYNQLKIDYELLNTASEHHRKEIFENNKERVRQLEKELESLRAKSSQQAESHKNSVTQIIADYEAKLRSADDKIRQLNRLVNNNPASNVTGNVKNITSPLIKQTTAPRGGKSYLRNWPMLDIQIAQKVSAPRGRGRGGGTTKRKLFKPNDENPIDLD